MVGLSYRPASYEKSYSGGNMFYRALRIRFWARFNRSSCWLCLGESRMFWNYSNI